MDDILAIFGHWQLSVSQVREQVYRAPTPRERERWHALWLLARGWPAAQVAEALGRDAHTIGEWVESFRQQGPAGLSFEQSGGSPPPSTRRSRRS
jgi:transposase